MVLTDIVNQDGFYFHQLFPLKTPEAGLKYINIYQMQASRKLQSEDIYLRTQVTKLLIQEMSPYLQQILCLLENTPKTCLWRLFIKWWSTASLPTKIKTYTIAAMNMNDHFKTKVNFSRTKEHNWLMFSLLHSYTYFIHANLRSWHCLVKQENLKFTFFFNQRCYHLFKISDDNSKQLHVRPGSNT